MGKSRILKSKEVDDSEFFDHWMDDYFEKCKDVTGIEDTPEQREMLNGVLRCGSFSNMSREENNGKDTKNSYFSKLADRLNLQKMREGEMGYKSWPARTQLLLKVFGMEEKEFLREYDMFIEGKTTEHPHETTGSPKKEEVAALIKQAEVHKPDPFVLLPQWVNEPIYRDYIESQLGFKIVKV